MTELNSEEWRNVHWVIFPTVVCWLCQPWSKSLKSPCRLFQPCSPDSQKHEHTRGATGKEGWRRQARNATLLMGWACSSSCCCHSSSLHHSCSPPLPHTILAYQAYISSPAFKGGRNPPFTSRWALVSFTCVSCSHHLSVGWEMAWQLGEAQVSY